MKEHTIFRYEGETNDNFTNGDIYGIFNNKWQKIYSRNEWAELSALNKQEVFNQITDFPSGEILTNFAPFSMLHYSDNEKQKYFNINYIPKNQLLIMKDFIDIKRFNRILNIQVNTVEINGLIYITLTNNKDDEITFFSFNEGKWIPTLKFNLENYYFIDIEGNKLENIYPDIDKFGDLTNTKLSNLTSENLDLLLNPTHNQSAKEINALGFAFLFIPKDANANLSIKDIIINTDIKGTWDSTVLGVDYTYSYPDDSSIKIIIKQSGKYKINYMS